MPESLESDARSIGVLKAISDDWSRWHFQSAADVNVYHTVDLTEWECSGGCSCPHFEFRIRPLLAAGVIRPHQDRAKCKHIRRADQVLVFRVKKNLAQSLNPKPKRT